MKSQRGCKIPCVTFLSHKDSGVAIGLAKACRKVVGRPAFAPVHGALRAVGHLAGDWVRDRSQSLEWRGVNTRLPSASVKSRWEVSMPMVAMSTGLYNSGWRQMVTNHLPKLNPAFSNGISNEFSPLLSPRTARLDCKIQQSSRRLTFDVGQHKRERRTRGRKANLRLSLG